MRDWVKFCSVITLLATVVASLQLAAALQTRGISAPQEAAAAAIACAIVIIPYVFTRCFDIWQRGNELAALRDVLAALKPSPAPESPPAPQIITPAELLASANALIRVAQAENAK